jgi:hypothetical protein
MLFWKEYKDNTKCMHYGTSRYVKVINKDGASVTSKVVVKQLHYMPITSRLKRLYLSKEIAKQMRWHKEGKHDSEDLDIMSHLADTEAWEALDHFDPEFARDLMSVHHGLSRMVSNLTVRPTVRILASQFCRALQSATQQMSKTRFCIPCPCHSRS